MKNLIVRELPIKFNPLEEWEKHFGYTKLKARNKFYCGCCGKEINICDCKAKLHERKDSGHKTFRNFYDNSIYYMTTEALEGHLLMRYFLLSVNEKIGQYHSEASCHEVIRFLVNRKGKVVFARKDTKHFMYNYDFIYDSSLKVRKYSDTHDFNAYAVGRCTKPQWLKYIDLKGNLKVNNEIRKTKQYTPYITPLEWIKWYIANPTFIETMVECNRYDLLAYRQSHKRVPIDNELMMMLRKGRIIPDYRWADYVEGCRTLNKDLKNINILDPADFQKAKTTVEKQCRKIKDERELVSNIANYNPGYIKRISKIVGIEFGNEKFSITILPNVKAFHEEAAHMCHCVYRMGYYKKEDSYIFSIKNNDGKRIETAEIKFDRNKLKIAQCYGYGDKYTEYHSEILELLKTRLTEMRNYING